jgi:hypothetical protein
MSNNTRTLRQEADRMGMTLPEFVLTFVKSYPSQGAMARHYGVSPSYISHALARAGAPRKSIDGDPELNERIRQLAAQGMGNGEIARQLGIKRHKVYFTLHPEKRAR